MTTYCFDDDLIYCGFWRGCLDDFETRVKETHKNNKQFLDEYLGFIEYIKGLRAKTNGSEQEGVLGGVGKPSGL